MMMDEDKSSIAGDNKKAEAKINIPLKVSEHYFTLHLNPEPSIDAVEGIKFDFCRGLRLTIPVGTNKKYRVRYWDYDTGSTLYDGVLKSGDRIFDKKIYFRKYVLKIDDADTGRELFLHVMDCFDREVMVSFDIETLGDVIAWFRAVEEFRLKHQCRMIVAMRPAVIPLFAPNYPEIKFIEMSQMIEYHPYACYYMGIEYSEKNSVLPYDFRHSPLNWVGYNMLGLDPRGCNAEIPPLIDCNDDSVERQIKEPYVCISSMASGLCKVWWHPFGWDTVVAFLKKAGYRVIDIDGDSFLQYGFWSHKIPSGAEDFTGKAGAGKTLRDRANLLKYCDFFIGLGSGLSWLAWAMKKPVVLIGGFSLGYEEFYTPYRVINNNVCHGCFNDTSIQHEGLTNEFCPRHKNTPLQFSCSYSIQPWQVTRVIAEIPEFKEQMLKAGYRSAVMFNKQSCSEPFAMGIAKINLQEFNPQSQSIE